MRKRLRKKKRARYIRTSQALAAWARETAQRPGMGLYARVELIELAKLLEFEVRWATVWRRFK